MNLLEVREVHPWFLARSNPDDVNKNNVQYLVDNNGHNDSQTVSRASFGPAIHTTNITPLVAPKNFEYYIAILRISKRCVIMVLKITVLKARNIHTAITKSYIFC